MGPNSAEGAFPLAWPTGRKRTPAGQRRSNGHMKTGWESARRALWGQLEAMRASSAVISSNLPLRLDGFPRAGAGAIDDPGVAVYFTIAEEDGQAERRIALACDRWARVEQNLRAIGLHVEALRGMDRWGVGSVAQAFAGYAALPPAEKDRERPWRIVFGVEWSAWGFEPSDVADRYRELSLVKHPDRGGTAWAFQELVRARDQALEELKRRGD